ncbi:hypothetical protein [Halobacterium jilantaiense]|uniref:Uncharacterized protein n=1 Tax=Halobacterium jilantaiense TaxID=355548 RepID=A0A1I0PV84_9EURY|nr:hypothetical protein [Halobacterium jilantaiense]SEW18388.1 hypothetical protein SAMN04487945_1996 [Halobacterium jilantaiense]
MTESRRPEPPVDDAAIRDTYEEYDLEDARVAMIADPHNEHAWIQSDVTVPVTQ